MRSSSFASAVANWRDPHAAGSSMRSPIDASPDPIHLELARRSCPEARWRLVVHAHAFQLGSGASGSERAALPRRGLSNILPISAVSDEIVCVSTHRTAWRFLFAILLRKRGPRWLEVRDEVPLSDE